jgi:hypothetical protein
MLNRCGTGITIILIGIAMLGIGIAAKPSVRADDGPSGKQAGYSGVFMGSSPDTDADGVPDETDNSPCTYNPDQLDSDLDGVGNADDNAPFVYNPSQEDSNGDGTGDVCDPGAVLNVDGAKAGPDGTPVGLAAATVSAVFSNDFYIQSDSRASGIMVDTAIHRLAIDLSEGVTVSIEGRLRTNASGERYIEATAVASRG